MTEKQIAARINANRGNVQIGQIWEDNDQRMKARRVIVLAIHETHARCQVVHTESRFTDIRLDRMRPTSTGWRLVQHADGTPA